MLTIAGIFKKVFEIFGGNGAVQCDIRNVFERIGTYQKYKVQVIISLWGFWGGYCTCRVKGVDKKLYGTRKIIVLDYYHTISQRGKYK